MVYLVTGGAGFIGSHMAERLLEDGHDVVIIDDLSHGNEKNLQKGALFIKRKVQDVLDDVFKENKFDAVFHFAAVHMVQYSIDYPEETHKANVEGTHNLLMMCRKHGVKRFIMSSSAAVYGEPETLPIQETSTLKPMSPYALHKKIAEDYCRLYHFLYQMETVCLRYFNVYGPRQNPEGGYANLIPKVIKLLNNNKSPTIFGDGEQTRDFIFVGDVVEANMKAATATNAEIFGKAFNIGTGKNLSVNDVMSSLIKISNSEVKPVHGPPVIEPKHALADVSRAKKTLGWEPKTNFFEGIKRTYNHFKN